MTATQTSNKTPVSNMNPSNNNSIKNSSSNNNIYPTEKIGIVHLPNQKHKLFLSTPTNFNILIAGSRGMGKSSFISSLKLIDSINNTASDIESNTSISTNSNTMHKNIVESYEYDLNFQNKRNILRNRENNDKKFYTLTFTESNYIITENKSLLNIKVIEVDGVGDSIVNENTTECILKYIRNMSNEYYCSTVTSDMNSRSPHSFANLSLSPSLLSSDEALEYKIEESVAVTLSTDTDTEDTLTTKTDNRPHVFLYFFNPSSPSKLDLQIIQEVSKVVNVIPCCSKSDILMDIEIERIESSDTYSLTSNNDNKHNIFLPIQFITQKDRVYSYGKVEESEENNLRDTLIKRHILRLKNKSLIFYEAFKQKKLIESLLLENSLNGNSENEDVLFLKKYLEN
ncbi:Cell division control protein 3 [Cucumispora dikerogammari]|nr:Cell division control protein 3 [Cucumispora dikerogammari]